MAEGGDLLDQKQYWYHRLFGSSDFEDEQPLPSPPIVQTEPKQRCSLKIRVRKIPGTNLYENLSYQEPKVEAAKRKLQCEERQEKAAGNKITAKPKQQVSKYENLSYQDHKKQADVIQEPKVEAAANRKLQCEERQEKAAGNKITAKPKLQVSKYAKKKHGDSVRARIEWKSKHLAVRKTKHLGVHKPSLLMAF